MSKLVVLSFGNGDCEHGVQSVTLQIWQDNNILLTKSVGSLPPTPEIPQLYTEWQSKYRQMGLRFRREDFNYRSRLEAKSGQVTNFSSRDIEDLGQKLKKCLNEWLKSDGFFRIWQRLLMNVKKDEEIRLIIETESSQIRLLPWHLWEFIETHPKSEIALSPLEFERPFTDVVTRRTQGRILAILGDSTGIDVEADQKELENLGNVETVLLAEPTRKEVSKQLWDYRGWDILFFAGHSLTEASGTEGKIFINNEDFLKITSIKNTIKKAISRGLKLAIFNSCDGLGIASELAALHVPQAIVMREPVPDLVAQEFLKYFLEAFSRGESLYLAVREARERLESIEDEFPCASWLPVICQNPAEAPVSWQELCDTEADEEEQLSEQHLSASLRFMGDRIAGKSTYLASLVRWPNSNPSGSPVQTVKPMNEDAETLLMQANDILEQGSTLAPTFYDTPRSAENYRIQIVIKKQSFEEKKIKMLINKLININIECKEYMGELFTSALLSNDNPHWVEAHLKDCLGVDGLLVLIDYFNSKDEVYAASLDTFISRLTRLQTTTKQRRLALIFTKCDLPELWLNRTCPRELASTRFPQVYTRLQSWQQLGAVTVEYFTTSAFGMIGTQFLEPNSRFEDDIRGFSPLKSPKYWKPFGLISPIYWICTGQRYKDLDIA